MRPHRRQPTRLPCPWDSPGKNTGVGCHFLLQRMKVKKWKRSSSVVSDSSQPHGLQPTRLLHPWDFPGKSTGVGCNCLLHVFSSKQMNKQTQEVKWFRDIYPVTGPHQWLSGKESTSNAGDTGSIPRSGRYPGGEYGNPLQYSCLENAMDRGAWQASSP